MTIALKIAEDVHAGGGSARPEVGPGPRRRLKEQYYSRNKILPLPTTGGHFIFNTGAAFCLVFARKKMVRKLKHHEERLLRKVDFLKYKQDGNRSQVIRRFMIQKPEDYDKLNKICGVSPT
jgi:hypothetical protein